MWYYYRTEAFGCELADADVVRFDATVSLSTITTTGKYPEYHEVWEDDALRVVAVFGKYEDGATDNADAGIAAYNRFVSRMRSVLGPLGAVTTPVDVPPSPGVGVPDVTFEATLPDGKLAVVTGLLVDNVRTAGPVFDARYAALSTRADLIVYSGHAGLGANIRALATKGEWVAGQYVLVFMNGCDTYAYVDDALFAAHREVNPDDVEGTKHVDMVTNAMPAFFHSTADATTAFIRGLLAHDDPRTFEQLFAEVDPSQVVLVSGEHDNVFHPGMDEHIVLDGSGSVTKDEEDHYQTELLPAGDYTFTLSGDNDADLYVRVGSAPTVNVYDCRPFIGGSAESCKVSLAGPAVVHTMVRGWASSSSYQLRGTGTGGDGGEAWAGISEAGSVAQNEEDRFTTPELAPGRYLFSITGTDDADLYVRVGDAPTTDRYDCRPFKSGSSESCSVDLAAPAAIHVMVRGWAAASTYQLAGNPQ
jgi:hypothetical protein